MNTESSGTTETIQQQLIQKSKNLVIYIITQSKMGRILLFLFIFFFIFKIINHILTFFDISQNIGYGYFIWFSILIFLFALLPLKRSYL